MEKYNKEEAVVRIGGRIGNWNFLNDPDVTNAELCGTTEVTQQLPNNIRSLRVNLSLFLYLFGTGERNLLPKDLQRLQVFNDKTEKELELTGTKTDETDELVDIHDLLGLEGFEKNKNFFEPLLRGHASEGCFDLRNENSLPPLAFYEWVLLASNETIYEKLINTYAVRMIHDFEDWNMEYLKVFAQAVQRKRVTKMPLIRKEVHHLVVEARFGDLTLTDYELYYRNAFDIKEAEDREIRAQIALCNKGE